MKDSINCLENIFDIDFSAAYKSDTTSELTSVIDQILDLSLRGRYYSKALSILRHAGNIYSSHNYKFEQRDSLLESCIDICDDLPMSYDQKETLAYLRLMQFKMELDSLDSDTRMELAKTKMSDFADTPDDNIYDRVYNLGELALVLGNTVGGLLYSDVMDQLNMMIDRLPEGNGALRSYYYTQAAHLYSLNGESANAVEADRNLLEIIDSLEARYYRNNRTQRNYDMNRYVCLRRMLLNGSALTREELEELNDSVLSILSRDAYLNNDYQRNHRAAAGYYMAIKDYAKALPLLRDNCLNNPSDAYRQWMLKYYVEAASHAGDDAEKIQAYKLYTEFLEGKLESTDEEKVRELQMMFEIINETAQSADSIKTVNILNARAHKRNMESVLAVVAALVLMLGVAIVMRRRHKCAVSKPN